MKIIPINNNGYAFDNNHFPDKEYIEITQEEWNFISKNSNWHWGENNEIVVEEMKIVSEENKQKDFLRARRNIECFPIINRGQLWYTTLTQEQLTELNEWYRAWLDVTDTKVVPERPDFLDSPISDSAQEIL